jgi:ribosomal protein L37E
VDVEFKHKRMSAKPKILLMRSCGHKSAKVIADKCPACYFKKRQAILNKKRREFKYGFFTNKKR